MQEGQIGEELRSELASALQQITHDVLGESPEDVPVVFSDIPKGFGFRGGEPSTTSLVRGSIVGGVTQDVREDLMRRICDRWMEISGCTVDELVVSARDV
jgi:phenylpyruvate tautomerase PptA (4-oxalocrotonate tautomerase family)